MAPPVTHPLWRPFELATEETWGSASIRPRQPAPVVVVPYDRAWPAVYERVRALVVDALGERVLSIEHVGSTAVPGLAAKPMIDVDARLTVSDQEALRRRDFLQMTAEEIAAAEREVEKLVMPDDRVGTRRSRAAPPPGRIDARRTIRASLRTGGDMIMLRHRRPRLVHPPIVVLCDISGSMSAYTRVFLHFIHALGEHRAAATRLATPLIPGVGRTLETESALESATPLHRHGNCGRAHNRRLLLFRIAAR